MLIRAAALLLLAVTAPTFVAEKLVLTTGILDINLPGMNGFEVFENLAGSESTKNTSVIALSAAATEVDIKRGMELGFFECLIKPIDIEEVLKVVKAALESRHPA